MREFLLSESDIRRFKKYFVEGKRDKCWPWFGSRHKNKKLDTYGYFQIHRKGKQYTLKAHRIAFYLCKGRIDDDKLVCHTCNYQPCVNPYHLYQGTHLDNTTDKIEAGTQYRFENLGGEDCRVAKLSEKQAKYVLTHYSNRYGDLTRLGKKFNVTNAAIWQIVKGNSWQDLKRRIHYKIP